MSDAGSSVDHDDALARVVEELRGLLAGGVVVDADAFAARHGVSPAEVERCIRAVQALGAAADPAAVPVPLGRAAAPAAPFLPPDYEILGELGRGGMAVVYRARQRSLGRVVAVKVLQPGELLFRSMQERFLREARALARLRHPHIVSVHEVGEVAGHVFFSMDLVDGEPLSELVRRRELTPSRTVKLLRQVASAVAYSHANGLVHRDLKPANVLVDRAGDAFVVDFGLAQDLAVRGDLTGTGQLLGTPAYMSPEQARGDSARIGEATDVYSLGAVLYECLTGRPPFERGSVVETIRAVAEEEPVPPRRIDPRIPPELDVICRKAMAKEPEHRYPTAQALLEDLERFADGRPIRGRPVGLLYRARRYARLHAAALGAVAVTLVVSALVVGTVILPGARGRPEEEWLAAAKESLAKGDAAYAAKLAGDARRRYVAAREYTSFDPIRRAGPLGLELLELEATAQAAAVGGLLDEGRHREAVERARSALEAIDTTLAATGTWSATVRLQRAELTWAAARAHAHLADQGGLLATLAMQREHLVRQRAVGAFDGHGTKLSRRIVPALDRIAPALADPSHADHGTALLLLAGTLVTEDLSDGAGEWLVASPERGIPACLALLRDIPRWERAPGASGAVDVLRAVVRVFEDLALARRTEVTDALAALAGDASAPATSRACATELVAAFEDLPPRATSSEPLPAFDEASTQETLALRDELRGLSAAAALRKRVDAAVARLGGRDPDGASARWVAARTGLPASSPEIERLWRTRRDTDPRSWSVEALGLAGPPEAWDAAAVLAAFLATPGRAEPADERRVALHRLLDLVAPPGTPRPAWAHGHVVAGRTVLHEPRGLAMAWRAALGAPAERRRVRAAAFVQDEHAAKPRLLWEVAEVVAVGHEARIGADGDAVLAAAIGPPPGTPPGATRHVFHVPGPDRDPLAYQHRDVEHHFLGKAALVHAPEGLVLEWTSLWEWVLCPRGWTASVEKREHLGTGAVLAGAMSVRVKRRQGGVESEEAAFSLVTLAAFEPESADPAEWGWSGWTQAVAAAGHPLPAPPRSRDEPPPFLRFALVAATLALAGFAIRRAVRRAPLRARLPAAAWVVVLGLAASANHVELAGADVRIEWIGFAIATCGTWILARGAAENGRRSGYLAAAAFAAALAVGLLGPFGGRSYAVRQAYDHLVFSLGLAVLVLPSLVLLACALDLSATLRRRAGLLALAALFLPAHGMAFSMPGQARWYLAWLGLVAAFLVHAAHARAAGESPLRRWASWAWRAVRRSGVGDAAPPATPRAP